MQLRHLRVLRFRGIKELDWTVGGRVVCLLGPGDSNKSTIIAAVEWVLYPRFSLAASDADFFEASTVEPIVIEGTISDLPKSLLSDQKYGLELRGWSDGALHDEPGEGDEEVLTVRLTIDASLEPTWHVINDRQPEPRVIGARDRELLGATRATSEIDRQLTWGRGSALLRLMDSPLEAGETLATAYRAARGEVAQATVPGLAEAAARATTVARQLGAGVPSDYIPALDPSAMANASALGLHLGPVPARASGLGSRRLAAIGIQRASFPAGAIALIDEVEAGLEPHRLRHLIRALRETADGQVLMTTHSEVAIVEHQAAELGVVRAAAGSTTVRPVPDSLQSLVRRLPEALLAKRIIVTEGKTELGICRALDGIWAARRGTPLAELGVVPVPGGGAEAPATAQAFAGLGYPTALLADSDVPLSPDPSALTADGVKVVQWAGDACTEQRVFRDLPWAIVLELLEQVAGTRNPDAHEAVYGAVATVLGLPNSLEVEGWLAAVADSLRAVVDRLHLRVEATDEIRARICAATHARTTGGRRLMSAVKLA